MKTIVKQENRLLDMQTYCDGDTLIGITNGSEFNYITLSHRELEILSRYITCALAGEVIA